MISCRRNYLILGIATALTLTNARRTEILTPTTGVAPALITTGPEVDHQAILRRGNVATCGYVSGNAASPLTCPSAYSCTSTVHFIVAWACCDQIQCQGNYRLCVDYGGEDPCGSLDKDVCTSIYTSILSCSSAAPSCISYARSRSLADTDIRYSYGCGQTSGSILALATPVNGKADEGKVTSAAAASSTGSSPTDATSNNNADTPSPSSSSSSNNNNANTPSNKSTGLSPGEIAGIAIPSAAMIAAIIVAWWKRHQVVWCITCGFCGSRHSKRPPVAPGHHPLSTMPSHAAYGPLKQQPVAPPVYTPLPGPYNPGFAGVQYGG